eukprot:9131880-Pyramimonas_sp.AAC.1
MIPSRLLPLILLGARRRLGAPSAALLACSAPSLLIAENIAHVPLVPRGVDEAKPAAALQLRGVGGATGMPDGRGRVARRGGGKGRCGGACWRRMRGMRTRGRRRRRRRRGKRRMGVRKGRAGEEKEDVPTNRNNFLLSAHPACLDN